MSESSWRTEGQDGRRRVVALAGGVGGARLVDGLSQRIGGDLATVVNTADDFVHLGLSISPDLDTIIYTLAGLANPETGWGRADESWATMEALRALGGEDWFRLGDKDLATHLYRTGRLQQGHRLTEITRDLCTRLGIRPSVLPMTDAPVSTIVHCAEGDLPFQDYFVREQCGVAVTGFTFRGAANAAPSPEVRAALTDPGLCAVVICPSNPFVSIDPILAIPGLRRLLEEAGAPVVAVSPLIGGRAVKGPAGKMMAELGRDCSTLGIAAHYGSLISGIVIDEADATAQPALEKDGLKVVVTDTLMRGAADRLRVADACLALAALCRR